MYIQSNFFPTRFALELTQDPFSLGYPAPLNQCWYAPFPPPGIKKRLGAQGFDLRPSALQYFTANPMRRRTLLQWLAAAAGTLPFPAVRAWGQAATFPGNDGATLRALAALVLPSELGRAGTDRIAEKFEHWVRDYRPGADMEHGYGFTRVRAKAPSPAPSYLAQLAALREPLAGTDAATRRKTIEAALEQANIKDLPRMPDGKHIVTDLMSFYFQSADANDLCYRAAIQRYNCRGLDGSENPPPPLKGSA